MAATENTAQTTKSDSLLEEIVRTVAKEEQCDELDLPPLYETLDPENLTQMVEESETCEVTFQYHGYTILINRDGHVQIAPL